MPAALVESSVDTLAPVVQPPIDAVTAVIQASICAVAPIIEALIDSIPAPIEACGCLFPAGVGRPVRCAVEAIVHAIASFVQPCVNTVAA